MPSTPEEMVVLVVHELSRHHLPSPCSPKFDVGGSSFLPPSYQPSTEELLAQLTTQNWTHSLLWCKAPLASTNSCDAPGEEFNWVCCGGVLPTCVDPSWCPWLWIVLWATSSCPINWRPSTLPFALRLEVSMGSSGFPNGVLGAGTATTDLDLGLILIIESEPIAALAIQAHNLNSERSRLFWDSIKSSYEAVRMIS